MWENHANDFYSLEDVLYDVAFHVAWIPWIYKLLRKPYSQVLMSDEHEIF